MRIIIDKKNMNLTPNELEHSSCSFSFRNGRRFTRQKISLNTLILAVKEAARKPGQDIDEIQAFFRVFNGLKNRGYEDGSTELNKENFLVQIITKIKHFFAEIERNRLLLDLYQLANKAPIQRNEILVSPQSLIGENAQPSVSQSTIENKLKQDFQSNKVEIPQVKNSSEETLIQQVQVTSVENVNAEQVSKEAFFNAIDLMFDEGTLTARTSSCSSATLDRNMLLPNLCESFTPHDQRMRYKNLKNALSTISSTHLNFSISYRNWMSSIETTLLIQAITEIRDTTRRLAIVNLLLEKGANPTVSGFVCTHAQKCECVQRDLTPLTPLNAAIKTGDEKLIETLKLAIENTENLNRTNGRFATEIKRQDNEDRPRLFSEARSTSATARSNVYELFSKWGSDYFKDGILKKFDLEESFNRLKEEIAKILPEDIEIKSYTYGALNHHSISPTFLLLAIQKIKDPLKRLEIVRRLLLEKGANPRIKPIIEFYEFQRVDNSGWEKPITYKYQEIDLVEEAKKTGDQELVDLLNQTIKSFDDLDRS